MANENNNKMNQSNYHDYYNSIIPSQPFVVEEKHLQYYPKLWEDNELIEAIEMNNIEQGILIALDAADSIGNIKDEALAVISSQMDSFNQQSQNLTNQIETIQSNISSNVSNQLNTNNSNLLAALTNLLGSYYSLNSLTDQLASGKQTVDARITELYTAIFGNGSNNNITTLQTNLENLNTYVRGDNNASSLTAQITALQNELSGSGSGPSFRGKIEAAMGRPLEPTTTQIEADGNLNYSLLTLIENLQSVLGLSSTSSGELSLIEKIEGMVGRSLDTESGETIDQETGEYSNSIMSLINEIRGILGLKGAVSPSQSSSSLLDTIDNLKLAIYGTTNVTNTEINALSESLLTLEDNFYHITVSDGTNEVTQSAATLLETLYPIVYEVREANEDLEDEVSSYSEILQHVSDAYVDATTLPIGENDYLVLKRDLTAAEAQNEQDIVDNEYLNNTYLILPKGGGGGGATYAQYSVFDVSRPVGTPIIALGSPYTIYYKWITRDSDTNDDSSGVRGTLRLYKDNALLATIPVTSVTTLSNYEELVVSDYITLGTNNFKITISSDVTIAKSFYYTIEAVEPVLTSSFNPEIIQNNNTISFSFTMSIGNTSINKVLHILVDGVEQTFSNYNQTSERIQTVTFNTPSNGGHRLTAYFTSVINSEIITSNVLSYGIICGTLNQFYIATDFEPNTQLEQYDNIVLNYLARGPRSNTVPVTITITDGSNNVYVTYDTMASTSYERWSSPLNISISDLVDSLQLYVTLRVNNSNENQIIIPFTLLKNTRYDFSPITTNLRLYLTADQKSNTSSSRNVWENSSPDDSVEVAATLSNFLFYRDVDGWQRDADDKYYLKLRNKARVEIPFSVFNFEQTSGNITDGMTFEIEFKTEDVVNYDTVCIACYDPNDVENGYIRRGIILSPQNSRFQANLSTEIVNTGSGEETSLTRQNILNAYYKEEEKMTVDFVINKTTGNSNTNENSLMYIYINGILSGATPYTTITNFSNGKIVIGSDQCTTDIYSIKYYSRALNYREILQNWISNEGNLEKRAILYNKNTYTAANDTELFDQFKVKSPTTPYMVIMTNGDLNDSMYMPIQKGSEYAKDADFYFYDPLDTTNNIGAIASDNTLIGLYGQGQMKVQVQGTSSQYYYRKNYKLKFITFTQDGVKHKSKKALTDADYDITYETQTNPETGEETQVEVSRTLKAGLSKAGYKLSSTSYPTWTFCIKADVASSESANNTRLTMLYDEISREFYLTPPQEADPSIRQGIEGRPVVAWYYNKTTSQYTLLGKYNFNNDKGTDEVYGLEGDTSAPWAGDQSWEVKNNGESPLTLFNYNNENVWNEWYNAFEARFPDQDDTIEELTGSDATNITNVSAEEQAKWIAGLKQAVKWVNDTVTITTLDNSGNDVEATDDCIADFKAHFEDYFNLEAMLFFYIFTEFFLMVDNRAKNMFLTRYIIKNDRPSSYDVNTLTADGTNNANYFGWFSFPYDFDTALGIDNNGRIRFDYHYEDTDLQPDGTSVIFNGQRSKLWKAFKKAYAAEIKNEYIRFSSKLSYNYVENLFENHQSVWSEAIFNEDMIHKYINWSQAYLYMLLGSKESHRKWWLNNRFRYFNSKYQVGKNSDRIYLRVAPRSYSLNVSTYADSYVNIEIGANGTPRTVRAPRGTSQVLSYTYSEQDQQTGIDGIETIIYPASALNSISGIASLQAREADFSQANRLETLKLGNATTVNTNLSTLTLGQNAILRHFDMRNYSGYRTNLDLSNYISLETVYLSGTNIPTVNLPNGGILVTIQYPTSISAIKIENQPYLENLIIGAYLPEDEITDAEHEVSATNHVNDYTNINALYLDNVGILTGRTNNIDSLEIVEQMDENGFLYLDGISWEMTPTEFYPIFQKIDTMYGFVDGHPSTDAVASLGGTLYLHGSFPEGFSLADIGNRFGDKLQVVAIDDQGNEHPYYTVVFIGLNNETIETQYVAEGGYATSPEPNFTTSRPETRRYFTIQYINNYNVIKNSSWVEGSSTRWDFNGWDFDLSQIITENIEIRATSAIQYRMNYILQTSDPEIQTTEYDYFFEGRNISDKTIPSFERNYYKYSKRYWTLDSNQQYDSYETGDTRTKVSGNDLLKTDNSSGVQTWYAVYSRSPQTYSIKLYNTDINGNKTALQELDSNTNELKDVVFERAVISVDGGLSTKVKISDLQAYVPNETNHIAMIGAPSTDANKADADRDYRFLGWKPYIPSSTGLQVTGNMDICLTYYYKDDIFNNYFLNKLVDCNLGNTITSLPKAAFFHNSNLRKLRTSAATIGDYSFANFNTSARKIFIFDAANPTFDKYCFYRIQNAIIIFLGYGAVVVDDYSFDYMNNCSILIPNSEIPIVTIGSLNNSFSSFQSQNNKLYVKNRDVYPNYAGGSSQYNVPYNLIASERAAISQINDSNQDFHNLMQEAGLE